MTEGDEKYGGGAARGTGEKRDDESLNWHFSEFEWLVGDVFFLFALIMFFRNNNKKTSFHEAT